MSVRYGKKIKTARLAAGMTQQTLAEKLDVSCMTISNWENGRTEPREDSKCDLEKILDIGNENRSAGNAIQQTGAFGPWLNKTRLSADMSVPELADRSGVSAVAIYNIENGVSLNPREGTRRALARALKADLPSEVVEEAIESQYIYGLGSLVDFDPYSTDDRPPEPGVYVFYDVSERPVYIGKAGNIAQRIAQHAEKFWFKQPIVSSASYIAVPDADLRHQIEQLMIKFLKSNAVLNRQSVER